MFRSLSSELKEMKVPWSASTINLGNSDRIPEETLGRTQSHGVSVVSFSVKRDKERAIGGAGKAWKALSSSGLWLTVVCGTDL